MEFGVKKRIGLVSLGFFVLLERAGTSIGPLSLSKTTHVRRPVLQTFRELNSHEVIPVFNGDLNVIKFYF